MAASDRDNPVTRKGALAEQETPTVFPESARATQHDRSCRDAAIDVARAIAMILVVYGHGLEVYFLRAISFNYELFEHWKIIYSVHMPLFFFISGVLCKKRGCAPVISGSAALVVIAFMMHGMYRYGIRLTVAAPGEG